MYFLVILYLSMYVLGRSFFILCIGKCDGSLSMYGGDFEGSNSYGGGSRVWCPCVLMGMFRLSIVYSFFRVFGVVCVGHGYAQCI